eukprot:2157016-Prymnesium_polylepis.1
MADSEHGETFEDAEDSGDEQQRVKTRKTASGPVLIHSKEGTTFKDLKSTYAVLLGGEIRDAGAADGQRRRGARGERAAVRPDRPERGRHGAGQGERRGRHRPHPDCCVPLQPGRHLGDRVYVTQDVGFCPLGTVLIFESFDGMRRRAAANAGRSIKVEHVKKEECVLVTVWGLGAIDDTNID